MRILSLAIVMAAMVPAIASAQVAEPKTPAAPSPAAKFSTNETDIATLLANPATKAVLVKHIPAIVSNEQIGMAGSMTLRSIQSYAPGLTTEVLDKIDADLAKIPAK